MRRSADDYDRLTGQSHELIELTTVRQTPIMERLTARFRRRPS